MNTDRLKRFLPKQKHTKPLRLKQVKPNVVIIFEEHTISRNAHSTSLTLSTGT